MILYKVSALRVLKKVYFKWIYLYIEWFIVYMYEIILGIVQFSFLQANLLEIHTSMFYCFDIENITHFRS